MSITCASLHNQKISCNCVCVCVQAHRRVYASACVCVCVYVCCSEPCALVLLKPAVTCSLIPAAAHRRPRPSYVTTIHTNTHKFLTATHTLTFMAHTVLSTSDKVDTSCVFKPAIHSRTDRHVQTYTSICPVMFRLITRVHGCERLLQVLIYRGLKLVELIRIHSLD